MSDEELPIRAILERIEGKVDQLAGLPGTVERLTNELLEVRQTAADLKQQLEHHGEQLSAHRRQLRDTAPALEKLGELAAKVDVLIPRVEHALDRLDAVQEQTRHDAERRAQLEKSVSELEEEFHERERATGGA